jgi:hypothetical protein
MHLTSGSDIVAEMPNLGVSAIEMERKECKEMVLSKRNESNEVSFTEATASQN